MKPRIEIWKCDQNLEERHFFMPNEANTYIFGFNPKLIPVKVAKRIVRLILAEVTGRSPRLHGTPNSMRRMLKRG